MAPKDNWIIKNLLGALAFFAVVLIAASLGLRLVTRHGRTVQAPDFTNMTLEEASQAASQAGVRIKVTDSVFVRRLGAGVVYRQLPKPGATVKQGRSIFLTINSIVPRKVVVPNLYGYSVLEARAELQNRGLNLGRLLYVRDIATNNVLRQSIAGVEIKAGDLVVSGSTVDLTVGLGREDNTTTVPRLTGMKYVRAVDALHDAFLNEGNVRFDPGIRTYADSMNAVVYRQDAAGAVRTLGTSIGFSLTLDPVKVPEDK